MSLPGTDNSLFVWKDFSRFVEATPVDLGWLVFWGQYHDMGRTRELIGQRTYVELSGARRRVADAVLELTRNPALVSEAMTLFDRTILEPRQRQRLPLPL